MHHLETVLVSLLVAVGVLGALASRLRIPYPILLVLGGLVLGFVPGAARVQLDPDLVLVIFLPPLLYASAFFVELRELRADARTITLLSVGLVLATTVTVAVTLHALVGELPWAACFALGAIIAPTDAIAATTIARHLGVPRRVVAVLEGESLVNDASALVTYRVAVGVITGGSFSLLTAGGEFVLAAPGGVAIGYVVARVIAAIRRRIDDPTVEITITLLSPYAAYLPAEAIGASGVLAAVTLGVAMGWWSPALASPEVRQRGFAFWEVLTFLLNATLFVLIGLQLPSVLDGLRGKSTAWLVGTGAAISAVVIATRILWVNTTQYFVRTRQRRPGERAGRVGWRAGMVTAWSGMRGAVSLAAALALPAETPQRELLIFLTFAVILATLVLQGLTLPALIRALGVHEDASDEQREELEARLAATRAALDRIDELAAEDWTHDDTVERMRTQYDIRSRQLQARAGETGDEGYEDRSRARETMLREVLRAERAAIVEMRNDGRIANDVMHRIERELDLEEQGLETGADRPSRTPRPG